MNYRLTIYESDARTVRRETEHQTRRQALRSRDDYERRQGKRFPNCVTALDAPEGSSDARDWDAWRLRQGYSGDR